MPETHFRSIKESPNQVYVTIRPISGTAWHCMAALSVPAASVDAERSFNIYKSMLGDNRQSLKMDNMAMPAADYE
jgi:hypothetical protein